MSEAGAAAAMFRAFVFVPPKRSLVLQFPMGRGPGGRRARRASLSREAGRCVCVCVGGWGVGGMASARRPRSRECSRRFSPSGPGSVTRQTLAVKQPTTWLSVVRVGVRVETRRSFSRPFPRSPRSVLPAKVGLRPSAVGQHHSHRIDAQAQAGLFLKPGPRLGSTLSSLSEQTRGGKNV